MCRGVRMCRGGAGFACRSPRFRRHTRVHACMCVLARVCAAAGDFFGCCGLVGFSTTTAARPVFPLCLATINSSKSFFLCALAKFRRVFFFSLPPFRPRVSCVLLCCANTDDMQQQGRSLYAVFRAFSGVPSVFFCCCCLQGKGSWYFQYGIGPLTIISK